MDYVLDYVEDWILTPCLYGAGCVWAKNDARRQFVSLCVVMTFGGFVMYLVPAMLSFFCLFDRRLMKHPMFLQNQIRKEITCALKSIPLMGVLTAIFFLLEVRGHSKLYDNVSDNNLGFLGVSVDCLLFLVFTDTCIYWIHRSLHFRMPYAALHKTHHLWKVPTPFASHAFHPLDGFLQSVPYHVFVFVLPMHKLTHLLLFVAVNLWTVSIHDGNFKVPLPLRPFVNGSAHHVDHHLLYTCNYGQFFTLWDRLGGSFRHPQAFVGKGPSFDVRQLSDDDDDKRN